MGFLMQVLFFCEFSPSWLWSSTGSILGPVLFTVYLNDLLTVPKLWQTACYVDDPKRYLKFKTNELCNAVSAVNSDLNEICRWCCHNSLLMNPDKTKLLVIGVPQLLRQVLDFTITLYGKPISPTPVAKGLGVFLYQCLSYDEHIRKLNRSGVMKRRFSLSFVGRQNFVCLSVES